MMLPRLTVTRRVTLMFLLGLVASVLAVSLFATLYWRRTSHQKPARDSSVFAFAAMLVEARADPALTTRLLDLAKRDLPDDALTLYAESGALLVSTASPPFPPLDRSTVRFDVLELDRRDAEVREVVPIVTPAGDRFYALHRLEDKPAAPGVALWLWVTAALPIVCCLIAALLLARSITRPLTRIVGVSRALAEGQLSARVGWNRRDELGQLGATLDVMAERITALLRARTEMLALVSHELRTPLARIRIALDLAAEKPVEQPSEKPEPHRAPATLAGIGADLAELERLLGDTLTYTRIELVERGGGATPLDLEEVDPATLLDEAAERFRHAWTSRTLLLECPPDLPLLEADRVLLMRMLLNLLDNAAKYSPPEETIRLRASSDDTRIVVEVVDRGPGIDAADLERAFEPFFRSRAAQTRSTSDGLGLGLTLCRRVVEAHGGVLTAASAPGSGTTMRVVLPAR